MAYNFTEEQVQEAIQHGGTIVKVAKYLGCTWPTAKQYIDKYGLMDTLPQACVDLGGLAEESMLNILTHAAEDADYAKGVQPSIIFTLKAKKAWIETSGLLIGEDRRAPHERFMDALDKITENEPEAGEGTETE